MKTYNEHRVLCATKASRNRMVGQVFELADRYGWNHSDRVDGREIRLSLNKGATCVSLDFDGDSRVGVFLARWYVSTAVEVDADFGPYDAQFAAAIRGSNNPYHLCKATTCEDTFRGLLESLEGGFKFLQA